MKDQLLANVAGSKTSWKHSSLDLVGSLQKSPKWFEMTEFGQYYLFCVCSMLSFVFDFFFAFPSFQKTNVSCLHIWQR